MSVLYLKRSRKMLYALYFIMLIISIWSLSAAPVQIGSLKTRTHCRKHYTIPNYLTVTQFETNNYMEGALEINFHLGGIL